jgi:DNA-binding transcriptional ArsR family regulator
LTGRKARAATATAKADIIDWMSTGLADPPVFMPKAVDQLIEQLGDNIARDILDALDKFLGTRDQRKIKTELAAGHLFCSLLAALAQAMQEFGDDFNKVVSEVASKITSYIIGRKRIKHASFMTKIIAEAAAKSISRVMQHLTPVQNFNHVKLAVRVLAVIACPEPEKHEEVVRYCLKPLGEPIIGAEIQKRLKETMPDWMK